MTLWSFLSRHMLRHSSQTVSENNATMSYEELVIYAEILAKRLSGQTCCAIYCSTQMATAISLLGCFAAGVTAVPLSFRYGEKHCQKILRHVTPSCIITDTEEGLGIIEITDSDFVVPDPKPVLIMYTSGTSGTPKGAMLKDSGVLTNVCDIAKYYCLSPQDTILISRPLYHGAVLTGEFLLSLIQGARIVFSSDPFNPINIIKLMQKEAVTAFGATPTLLRLLARFMPKSNPIPLRHLVVSGECMSAFVGEELRTAFPNTNIYHVYGLTEAGPRVSYLPPKHFADAPDCVGIPLSNVQIKILNPKGKHKQVANGKEGILWIRGENIMSGYYKNPKLTKQVLRRGWLNTGDIALIEEHGWLKIKGRADDLIIRAGMNIYPKEIEDELKKDPRTQDALVYKMEDLSGGIQIALDISGNYSNENEVRALCLSILPSFQIPSLINLVKEIPHNGSGKVVRHHENS